MKKLNTAIIIYLVFLIGLLLISFACHTSNKAQQGASIGAGTGGSVGAVVGKSAGNTALGALIGGAVGGTAGAFIGHNMDSQADELKQTVSGATILREGEGIIVRFNSGILFDPGKADLKAEAQNNLKSLATSLQKNNETNALIIGHTDNSGTGEQNHSISLQRAESVKTYLTSNGIDATRISTLGKGDTEPIADNATIEGRTQNRRVEIVILANKQMRARAAHSGK